MILLHIDTSTTVCSVALSQNSEIIFSRSDFKGMNHAVLLSLFIEEALEILRMENRKPDAICVSAGPGSYTGLRIGVSTAKGLCYGFNIPLIALDTLKIMWQGAINEIKLTQDTLFCPMIDARRMEVYDELFDIHGNTLRETTADIIDEDFLTDYLSKGKVCFFGNGSDKCKTILTQPNAEFIENIHPLAVHMITMGEKAYQAGEFADLAYYEPFYLKEFQATTPKNKGL